MGIVFKIIMILSFAYISLQAFKIQRKERKAYVAKLKQEGKAATPKQAIFYFFAVFGGLYVIGIVITIIICWLKKISFESSRIFAGALAVFLVELCIGGVIWIAQEFLRTKKEMGFTKAVLSFIVALILLIGFLYVKYKF